METRFADDELEPRLQKLVDMGESGTDIMHGHLKNLMYECEQQIDPLDKTEVELSYYKGRMDALTECYILTYNLAFALNERIKSRG